MIDHDVLIDMLTRLKLTAIRDQLVRRDNLDERRGAPLTQIVAQQNPNARLLSMRDRDARMR
jgi:hypothetical protein